MMRDNHKFIVLYFGLFGVLTAIACTQGGALILLIAFLPLGLLTVAAPTILLYSVALVPLGAALMTPRRHVAVIAAAALIPIALAFVPSLRSEQEAKDFAARMSAQDFSRAAVSKPRSLELLGDPSSGMWVYQHSVGEKLAWCNDVCARLLFNGEADWVRMTTTPNDSRSKGAQRVTYHIEHRETCPELQTDGRIEKAMRDRLVAGDCLIAEQGDGPLPDAVAKLTMRYDGQSHSPSPPGEVSALTVIDSVKSLQIESRPEATSSLLVQQTETVARAVALPFYIGAKLDMQCGSCNGPTVGRYTIVTKPIDLAQVLRDTFGYKLTEISPPSRTDPRTVAEGMLALPVGEPSSFSKQQQDVLGDVLGEIAQKPLPSDADIELTRRIIADDRVTGAGIGPVIQRILRGNPAHFEALIPVVLDRMTAPVDQRVGHYKSELGWSLQNFSPDSLRPYQAKMIGIVESQPDWPSNGLLVRLAELGSDDAVNLVIRRLESSSRAIFSSPQQFAAIAACRASAEAWPKLEPAVLAHLTAKASNRLSDEDAPLLLALVRFDRKSQALDIVHKRGLSDEAHVIERLNRLEPGFDLKHCRDWL